MQTWCEGGRLGCIEPARLSVSAGTALWRQPPAASLLCNRTALSALFHQALAHAHHAVHMAFASPQPASIRRPLTQRSATATPCTRTARGWANDDINRLSWWRRQLHSAPARATAAAASGVRQRRRERPPAPLRRSLRRPTGCKSGLCTHTSCRRAGRSAVSARSLCLATPPHLLARYAAPQTRTCGSATAARTAQAAARAPGRRQGREARRLSPCTSPASARASTWAPRR
jgi:hypothetical protein